MGTATVREKRREKPEPRRFPPAAPSSEPAFCGKTGFYTLSLNSHKKRLRERHVLRISPKPQIRHFPALLKTASAETGVFF
jgi:hypothetical protein